MSDKDRRKKDGKEKSHDKQAMRDGAEFRKRNAAPEDDYTHNEHDIQAHKPGAPGDRTLRGAH